MSRTNKIQSNTYRSFLHIYVQCVYNSINIVNTFLFQLNYNITWFDFVPVTILFFISIKELPRLSHHHHRVTLRILIDVNLKMRTLMNMLTIPVSVVSTQYSEVSYERTLVPATEGGLKHTALMSLWFIFVVDLSHIKRQSHSNRLPLRLRSSVVVLEV